MAVNLRKYERQGEVVLMGDFNSSIGKASTQNENIGQYREVTNDKSGSEMSASL